MSPDKVERFKREIAAMEELHGDILMHDPSYSENLSLLIQVLVHFPIDLGDVITGN